MPTSRSSTSSMRPAGPPAAARCARRSAPSRTRCSTSRRRRLGIPVYELFGGPLRERIHLYWSHCGLYRVLWSRGDADPTGCEASRTSSSSAERSRRAASRRSRRTSSSSTSGGSRVHVPGFGAPEGYPGPQPRSLGHPCPAGAARGAAGGLRPRRRDPRRPQLQLHDRRLPQGRPRDRVVRALLDRDRHARRRRPALHP